MITRHILTLPEGAGGPARKVHYRRCGKGPPLLMVHQSPRSSAEYAALMEQWGEHFTCIAPDTPGFGQSDPLAGEPEIDAFADALAEFVRALGLTNCVAYGFHSGGIILVTAMRRHPELFRCLAIGGYAVWTPEEMAIFGERYLPEFHPAPYGEHLTWLWNRMLEQSWVFPWFDTREEARLTVAHADVGRVHQAAMEMLDAGNAYRAGYGAVLRAPRDIPPPDAKTPPVLITAYDGDPLQEHIDRLGEMPANWKAPKVRTPAEHHAHSLVFLQQFAGSKRCPELAEDGDEGWLEVGGSLIHWKGQRGSGHLHLHPPAHAMGEPGDGEMAIDLPGHGQSDECEAIWAAVGEVLTRFDIIEPSLPALPPGDPEMLYPDLTPDRFGTHLTRAWSAARAEAFFAPWYVADKEHATVLDPDALDPATIHARFLARLRAGDAARRWHAALEQLSKEG